MNVYDLQPDSAERKWVRFFTANNLAMPSNPWEEEAFFDAHSRIPIDRNTDSTPRGSKAKLADYSNVNHNVHPVFSVRAKRLLEQHLEGAGRWIELVYDEAPYWLFFITNVVDALDESKSEIAYFTNSTKVLGIDSYAFITAKVQGQFLFTLPQRIRANRLVTDAFIDLVHEHRLTGFMFQRLWSSDSGPVSSDLKDWEKPRITGLEPR